MIQHHIIRHSDRNKHIKLNNLTTKPIKERSNYIRYRLIEKKMILIPTAQCNEILNKYLLTYVDEYENISCQMNILCHLFGQTD